MQSPKNRQKRASDPGEERICSRAHIIAILRQLEASHELLRVSVAGCPDIANTVVLGIKDERDYLLLDEFSSAATNAAFGERKKVLVQARLRGSELRFFCKLIKVGADANIMLYAVSIPNEIIRKQRRNQFRLRLSPALSVPVTVPDLDGRSVTGEAFDLSAAGLGVLLNTGSSLERGVLLPDISIFLPESTPFITSLEVRFARADKVRHLLRVGGRFVGLIQKQERQLEHFLAEQQRKRCRHDSL